MKIVYVYPHFVSQAGTQRVLIDKMNYLATVPGYEVYMVTNEQENRPFSYPLNPSVIHIDLKVHFYLLFDYNRIVRLFKSISFNRRLKRSYDALMKELNPDIVITTTYHSNLMSVVGDCTSPYIRILESHIDKRFILDNDPLNQKSFLRWLHTKYQMHVINRKSRKFDLLVALMKEDATDWSRYVKTVVIRNVVHLNETGRLSELQSKRVIFVGRYTEQKGIPELFQIWEQVYQKHPDWQLELYGGGHLRDELRAEANRLQANIIVHDPVRDIFDHYIESSIFVLTSVYEPFGLVIPEAMSCGLPIVSFDCPYGPANIIKDGETGFLIANRDKTAFADKVCSLIESPSLRHKMGKAAVQSSLRFSADIIMPQWLALFEKLVEEHRA